MNKINELFAFIRNFTCFVADKFSEKPGLGRRKYFPYILRKKLFDEYGGRATWHKIIFGTFSTESKTFGDSSIRSVFRLTTETLRRNAFNSTSTLNGLPF